jgi:hypothetical protein
MLKVMSVDSNYAEACCFKTKLGKNPRVIEIKIPWNLAI